MFEYMLAGGIVASGADVYLMHVTTTPSVAYIAHVDDFDCGIMITASHNPYYDNGIKIINKYGEKMEEPVLNLCEDYIDGKLECFGQKWDEIPYATRHNIGQMVDYVSGRNRYIGYLISLCKYSFRDVKVGLDCANGTTWSIARAVFDALGANRCLAVDENGNVVTGDHIMYFYGKYMKERGKLINNTVVTTVMSNFGFFKALAEAGIDSVKTKVGDKYVHDYMVEHGCRIGGEQSGHIIFAKYASTGDGILTAIKVLEVMMAKKKKLSELAGGMQVFPQVLENVRVKDKPTTIADEDVQKAVSEVAAKLGDTGRILVRESGTEPLIRVMVEAESTELCKKYVDSVISVIKKKGYAV